MNCGVLHVCDPDVFSFGSKDMLGGWLRHRAHLIILMLALSSVSLCAGCGATKVLTSSFEPLSNEKIAQIKPNVTTQQQVRGLMGEPYKVKGAEWVYINVNIYAKAGNKYIQELHVLFSTDAVVRRTTFVNIKKGDGGTADPHQLYLGLSPMRIGQTTFAEASASACRPSAIGDTYVDGSLVVRQLQYMASREDSALNGLPFVLQTSSKPPFLYVVHFDAKTNLLVGKGQGKALQDSGVEP
jgi:outer membrane protein assembly factor BamE (lipoprotein component of BamABCDE complex)